MVLEGRRIASGASRGRKVRTPKGAMPRNPGLFGRDTRGRKVERLSDGQCHRKQTAVIRTIAARVKRCGKSAPLEAQATRHGKPHRVQGQIGNPGAARSKSHEKGTGFGYRLQRQMILSTRKSEDRIRLTALPKPIQISKSRRTSDASPIVGRDARPARPAEVPPPTPVASAMRPYLCSITRPLRLI